MIFEQVPVNTIKLVQNCASGTPIVKTITDVENVTTLYVNEGHTLLIYYDTVEDDNLSDYYDLKESLGDD